MCVIDCLSSLYNNTGAHQIKWEAMIQPLKKPIAYHPPVILKSNTVTRFKIISGLRSYRITGGFLNTATMIFTIIKCFHRSKPKPYLLISPQQGRKKFKNHRRLYRRYCFALISTLKKMNRIRRTFNIPYQDFSSGV
jgi:hypothetical protein